MTAHSAFWLRPSQPSADERATYAAEARAMLDAERFSLLDREDDPAFGVDPSDAADMPIHPGCRVRLLCTPDAFVTVLRVFTDDTLLVEMVSAPGVRWRVGVGEVGYVLTPECAAMGEANERRRG